MTSASGRSLDQLEREAERNRAVLVGTVDALRSAVVGEVETVRRKASLDYIGTELRARARANPLRTFAIGAGLTLPLWKAGRRIPMPLVLIGAGVALARPAMKTALADAADGVSDRAAQLGDWSGDVAGGVWGRAKNASAQAGQQIADRLDAGQSTLRAAKNDAAARASELVSAGSDTASGFASDLAGKGAAVFQGGSDRLADVGDQASRTAAQTRSRAIELFNENPLLVAGAGLALGALLAAIVPATETEGRLVRTVAPDLKQKASDLVDQGYDTVRTAAGDVFDGAVGRAKDHGLTPDRVQDAASDLNERLGAVVDATVGQHGAGHSDDTHAHS